MSQGPRLSPPKQPRSRKTLDRIVSAGLSILEERGPDGVTVQEVVKRARSSVGSFYARFAGKEDLLTYLADHVRESAVAEWRATAGAASEPPSAGGALSGLAEGAVDRLLEVRRRWEPGIRAAAGLADRAGDHAAFRRDVVEELAGRLLSHRNEIAHPSPERAVRVGLWGVLGVLDHEGSAVGAMQLDPEDVRRECVTLLLGYLSGDTSAHSGAVEFFDVWS